MGLTCAFQPVRKSKRSLEWQGIPLIQIELGANLKIRAA